MKKNKIVIALFVTLVGIVIYSYVWRKEEVLEKSVLIITKNQRPHRDLEKNLSKWGYMSLPLAEWNEWPLKSWEWAFDQGDSVDLIDPTPFFTLIQSHKAYKKEIRQTSRKTRIFYKEHAEELAHLASSIAQSTNRKVAIERAIYYFAEANHLPLSDEGGYFLFLTFQEGTPHWGIEIAGCRTEKIDRGMFRLAPTNAEVSYAPEEVYKVHISHLSERQIKLIKKMIQIKKDEPKRKDVIGGMLRRQLHL